MLAQRSSVPACHAGDVSSILIHRSIMKKSVTEVIDLILRIVLTVVLLLIPTVLAVRLWSMPVIESNSFLLGLFTTGVFLNIAEVIFLVRAVVFPRDNKKWWKENE